MDVRVLYFVRDLRRNGWSFERKGSIFELTKKELHTMYVPRQTAGQDGR